jgi:hypothetical protein
METADLLWLGPFAQFAAGSAIWWVILRRGARTNAPIWVDVVATARAHQWPVVQAMLDDARARFHFESRYSRASFSTDAAIGELLTQFREMDLVFLEDGAEHTYEYSSFCPSRNSCATYRRQLSQFATQRASFQRCSR